MARKSPYLVKDRLYERAKEMGFASRAAFKLQEIQKKHSILKKNTFVLDLGAAPGSWTQVALEAVGAKGNVIAVDLAPLHMQNAKNLFFIQGDIFAPQTQEKLEKVIQATSGQQEKKMISVVLSDLSPKLSGVAVRDHVRSLELAQKGLDFSEKFLHEGGSLVIKVFPGEELENFRKKMKQVFAECKLMHLQATRKTSREVYLLGLKKA